MEELNKDYSELSQGEQLEWANKALEKTKQLKLNHEDHSSMKQKLLQISSIFKTQKRLDYHIQCECLLIDILLKKREFEGILELLQTNFDLAKNKLGKQHSEVGLMLFQFGRYYEAIGDYDQAIKYCLDSLSLAKLPQNLKSQPSYCYDCLDALCVLHRQVGNFEGSIDYGEQALRYGNQVWEQTKTNSGKKWGKHCFDFLMCCYNLAAASDKTGNKKQQLYYLEKGFDVLTKDIAGTHFIQAYYFDSFGVYYSLEKDYDSAIAYFNKALIVKEITDSDNHRRLGTSYNNLAFTYSLLKDSKNALKFSKKSLNTLEKVLGKEHPLIANVLGVMASGYFIEENQEEGLKCLRRGLEISLQKLSEINQMTALFYHEIGKYSKDVNEQIDFISKAIDIKIKCNGDKHPMLSAYYHNLAEVYMNTEQYEKALDSIQKAINSLFMNYEETNFYTLPPTNSYLSISHLLNALELKAYAFYHLFLLNKKKNDFEASIQHYQLAVKLIDNIRQSYHTSGSQLNLSSITVEVYQRGIEVTLNSQMGNQYFDLGFHFSEKAKASLLLSSLQDLIAKTTAHIPKKLLERERQLKIELTRLEKNIQKEELKEEEKQNEKSIKQWQSSFFDHHREYLSLLKLFETNYPDYYQLKYDTQTTTPTELQSELQENQVVLSYFIGEKKFYIFILTPDEFEVIDIQLPTNFEALVQSFIEALTQHQFVAFVEKGIQLHQLLIAPIQDFIVDDFGLDEELKQVFVIPHGVLSYLPFEALISPPLSGMIPTESITNKAVKPLSSSSNIWSELDYLIHHCKISYHYSATLLYRHLLKKQNEEELPHSFAGFAPIYDTAPKSSHSIDLVKNSSNQKQNDVLQQSAKAMQAWATRSDAIRSDGSWISLPHSETEAKTIAQLFENKGLKAETFLRKEANKKDFAEAAEQFKFLLVAAHGLVNDEKTVLSGLVFYPNAANDEQQTVNKDIISNNKQPISKNESLRTNHKSSITEHPSDNILSMEETHHLDIQADLVVLSSCESGIGKLHKGEGMMAVNRGFLAAGANNVVSTLFKVYDKPSSLLTQYLFEEILEGKKYADALRLAKLKLMKQSNIDPKSWSGFVLIGG